ncbi:MAG: phosphomannomutase [Candidatus Harrisonbacteria bacterium CG10_big_fil_rev_8_21_14_0_10_45_28]|uniref:Phosphomannomutase n=1 Tax=Candidatus Harrisonbacteria bacterium CG10_big_fil_rev_8_21_14_0_10_45_28 TaxID=1974586 RepID=A0A2H0UMJ7_9BACT|nr:MAG: phosphomannomutase [Candidatus Harrisonbacteria bacterium CG10_big_fil_rev_8_21_14_0_10_45_28]
MNQSIFKAYDIRGIYPTDIDEDLAYKIAQAYCKLFQPKKIALGKDVRLSGPSLFSAMVKGFTNHGVDVVDVGTITTDMLYFVSSAYDFDGGISITASHNPREYNGMKLMKRAGRPVSGETGIQEIKDIVLSNYSFKADIQGTVSQKNIQAEYLAKCLSLVDAKNIKPMKVVVNGMFGPVIQNIKKLNLPLKLVELNSVPDGSFPKGSPDPLLPENRTETIEVIKKSEVAFGGAWDGDGDRFFLFDENGRFIPGYFLTAFLGKYFAQKKSGTKIIYDPRLTWATEDAVRQAEGEPLVNRVGHSFIKERMRAEDAVFAGENSGHFYFKDFYYADNGLLPFLLILEIISKSGERVSELFNPYFEKYFIIDETNFNLGSQDKIDNTIKKIEEYYKDGKIEKIDGVSVEYDSWRANIRSSNTQPLLRLNIEAKTKDLLEKKFKEISALIKD